MSLIIMRTAGGTYPPGNSLALDTSDIGKRFRRDETSDGEKSSKLANRGIVIPKRAGVELPLDLKILILSSTLSRSRAPSNL